MEGALCFLGRIAFKSVGNCRVVVSSDCIGPSLIVALELGNLQFWKRTIQTSLSVLDNVRCALIFCVEGLLENQKIKT